MVAMTTSDGWLRAFHLWTREPWKQLGSEGWWKGHLSAGRLPSFKPAGSRARLVRVEDVDAFLRGEVAR